MRLEVPDPARIIFSKPATTPTTATTVKECGKEGKANAYRVFGVPPAPEKFLGTLALAPQSVCHSVAVRARARKSSLPPSDSARVGYAQLPNTNGGHQPTSTTSKQFLDWR